MALASACRRAANALSTNRMFGAAIAHGVFVLQRAPADVERHDHRAGPAGGEIELEIAVGIERQDRDAIAIAGAERADARRRGAPRGRRLRARSARRSPQTMASPFGLICSARRKSVGDVHRDPPLDLLLLPGGLSAFFLVGRAGEALGEADREFALQWPPPTRPRRAETSGRSSSASPRSQRPKASHRTA